MVKDTGGQAFPGVKAEHSGADNEGMTLMDYFMAHAPNVPEWFAPTMKTKCPKADFTGVKINWDNSATPNNAEKIQEYQYLFKINNFFQWRIFYATAMIAERNKNEIP